MLRLLKYLTIIAFFIIATIFLSQNKGEIVINWMGYKIYTEITVAILISVIFIILLILAINFIKTMLWPITRKSNKTLLLLKKLVNANMLNKQNIDFILSDIYSGKIRYNEMLAIYKALKSLNNNNNINQRVLKSISHIERRVKKNISVIASEIIFRRLVSLKDNNKVIESSGRKGLTSKKISIRLLTDFSEYLISYPNKNLLALCITKFEQFFKENSINDLFSKEVYSKTVITYIKLLQNHEVKTAISVANTALKYCEKEPIFKKIIDMFVTNTQDKTFIKIFDRYVKEVFSLSSLKYWYKNNKDLSYNKMIAKINKLQISHNNKTLFYAFVSIKQNKTFECDNYLSQFPLKEQSSLYRKIAIENYKRKSLYSKALELYEVNKVKF